MIPNPQKWFDESISSSWRRQILCLIAILIVFFLPSIICVIISDGLKMNDALEIYMDPGTFSSKANQAYFNESEVIDTVDIHQMGFKNDDVLINTKKKKNRIYWSAFVIAMLGAVAFTGMFISLCGNFIHQRVDKYKRGYVRYKYGNHYVILGYNDMVAALVKQIIKKDDREIIVLMTTQEVEAVREKLFTDLSRSQRKKLVLVHGNRLSEEDLGNICISKAQQIYLFGEDDDVDHDTLNINSLEIISKEISKKYPNEIDKKIPCVTYLRNRSSFTLFQSNDIMDEVKKCLDFQPFSFDETWARKVFVNCESKINGITYPSLDRGEIDKNSEKQVHLIIIGMTQMGVTLALEAAHICHYPNFSENTKNTKTRITLIDEDAYTEMRFMVTAHDRFFRNCCYVYREENVEDKRYEPESDFLDVEFEFIKGNIADEWIRKYIEKCANDDNEILTIASCMNDTAKSVAAGLYLPDIVYDKGLNCDGIMKDEKGITVLVRQDTSSELINSIKEGEAKYKRYRNVYPFGMLNDGCELDDTILKWAKRMNYLYCKFDDLSGVPVLYPDDIVDDEWNKCSVYNKWSNIYNVMAIPTKLRSVGRNYTDLIINDLDQEEIELLTKVEHNRWNVEKLLMGFRPVTHDERIIIAEDIKNNNDKKLKKSYKDKLMAHYDIVPFNELGEDKPHMLVNRYDFGMTKGIIDIIKN